MQSYVYVAEAIDFATATQTKTRLFMAELERLGIPTFSPRSAWSVPSASRAGSGLALVNEAAIDHADVMVAVLDGVAPSVGVPAELQYAKERHIPTIVYCTAELLQRSQVIQHLATHGTYTTLDTAAAAVVDALQKRDNGVRVAYIQREDDVRDLPLPMQRKPGDIGLDLYVSDQTIIPPHDWRGIPSRVRVAPPPDVWFLIAGRSSSLHGRGLHVVTSVIDSGFRGSLFALAHNISDSPVIIERGERVAQLLPLPLTRIAFTEVSDLPISDRGEAGFGSTGR